VDLEMPHKVYTLQAIITDPASLELLSVLTRIRPYQGEGWLLKKKDAGRNDREWQERYFVLRGMQLSWYAHREDAKADKRRLKDPLDLTECSLRPKTADEREMHDPTAFDLVTRSKTYTLRASCVPGSRDFIEKCLQRVPVRQVVADGKRKRSYFVPDGKLSILGAARSTTAENWIMENNNASVCGGLREPRVSAIQTRRSVRSGTVSNGRGLAAGRTKPVPAGGLSSSSARLSAARRPQPRRPSRETLSAIDEEGLVGPAPSVAAGGEWEEHDDGEGNTYFYNTLTRKSTWERPAALNGAPRPPARPPPSGGGLPRTGSSQRVKSAAAAAAMRKASGNDLLSQIRSAGGSRPQNGGAANDPRLTRFKNMLKAGVPSGAVAVQMRAATLDPSLLGL
jgi:hypothetical protein